MAKLPNLLSVGGKGKGFKIFSSAAYKDHEKAPMAQMFWRMRYSLALTILAYIVLALSFPVEHIFRYGFSTATTAWLGLYFNHIVSSFGMSVFAEIPAWFERAFFRTDIYMIVPLVGQIVIYMLRDSEVVKEFNPYGKDKFDEKSSLEAAEKDVEKMGLFKGFMVVLGQFKKKWLKLDETLSVLCVAPPGTGKTKGVVMPTIFECDTVSMIVNDPKPELAHLTSGYRSTVGPVFIINWAGQDNPDAGIYYPSWNPLSPSHVPQDPAERDLYVDSMVAVLVEDKAASSADPHWTLSGRAALSGLIQFIVSKCERARANDYFYHRFKTNTFDAEDKVLLSSYYMKMNDLNAEGAWNLLNNGQMNIMNYVPVGTWKGIPPQWVGKEASLSMLLDWITTSQINITEELENRRRQGDQMVALADPMKDLFQDAVNEGRQFGYAHRSIQELTQLANTPDRERGSILSTVAASMAIFKNSAVRARTSHSDFHFEDLRGMIDPRDGKMKPVTVYLSINQVDADALNPITGIFVTLMSRFLIANPPEFEHAGKKLGPCPVLFVLDEFPKMAKLQAVIEGPDLGRGQKVSYLLIGQDLQQIAAKYSKENMEILMSTTAAKIVLRQNNLETAKIFSEMMGTKIKIETKDGKDEKKESVLFSPMDIVTMSTKNQLVILQGYANRPIKADHVRSYEDAKLIEKSAIPPSPAVPEFLVEKHRASMGYTNKN